MWVIASTFLFLITSSVFSQTRVDTLLKVMGDASRDYVFVAAHRGDWRNAPENSLQAIERSIAMGADIVELDVRITKDSIPVLMHDATLNRTTNGKGRVDEHAFAALAELRLRDGIGMTLAEQRIPTLEDALLLSKGEIIVNIDNKVPHAMDKVHEVILATGTESQVLLKGGSAYEEVKERYGSFLDDVLYMPIVNDARANYDTFINDFIDDLRPIAFEVVFRDDDSPILAQFPKIANAGMRIWVNSLWPRLNGGRDDERAVHEPDETWGWLVDKGVSMIQTDRPLELIAYLDKRGLRNLTHIWTVDEKVMEATDAAALSVIDSIMRAAHANGVMVRDGHLVAEWAYDRPLDAKIEVQSITKSIVSLLLGIALDEGKISEIDDKVICYFPAFNVGPHTQDITFRHLVTVSSGIAAKKHGSNYGNPNNMKPGVDARYHNDHFDELAKALTYVYGQTLHEVLNDRILSVIDAEVEWRADGYVISNAGDTIPVNAGYAFIRWTPADLAKIGYLYMHGGTWNGKQLVSSQYVQESLTPISVPLMVSRPNQPVREDRNSTYGYGWRGIKTEQGIVWYASGNGGQFCALLPEKNTVFVKINGYGQRHRPFRGLRTFEEVLPNL